MTSRFKRVKELYNRSMSEDLFKTAELYDSDALKIKKLRDKLFEDKRIIANLIADLDEYKDKVSPQTYTERLNELQKMLQDIENKEKTLEEGIKKLPQKPLLPHKKREDSPEYTSSEMVTRMCDICGRHEPLIWNKECKNCEKKYKWVKRLIDEQKYSPKEAIKIVAKKSQLDEPTIRKIYEQEGKVELNEPQEHEFEDRKGLKGIPFPVKLRHVLFTKFNVAKDDSGQIKYDSEGNPIQLPKKEQKYKTLQEISKLLRFQNTEDFTNYIDTLNSQIKDKKKHIEPAYKLNNQYQIFNWEKLEPLFSEQLKIIREKIRPEEKLKFERKKLLKEINKLFPRYKKLLYVFNDLNPKSKDYQKHSLYIKNEIINTINRIKDAKKELENIGISKEEKGYDELLELRQKTKEANSLYQFLKISARTEEEILKDIKDTEDFTKRTGIKLDKRLNELKNELKDLSEPKKSKEDIAALELLRRLKRKEEIKEESIKKEVEKLKLKQEERKIKLLQRAEKLEQKAKELGQSPKAEELKQKAKKLRERSNKLQLQQQDEKFDSFDPKLPEYKDPEPKEELGFLDIECPYCKKKQILKGSKTCSNCKFPIEKDKRYIVVRGSMRIPKKDEKGKPIPKRDEKGNIIFRKNKEGNLVQDIIRIKIPTYSLVTIQMDEEMNPISSTIQKISPTNIDMSAKTEDERKMLHGLPPKIKAPKPITRGKNDYRTVEVHDEESNTDHTYQEHKKRVRGYPNPWETMDTNEMEEHKETKAALNFIEGKPYNKNLQIWELKDIAQIEYPDIERMKYPKTFSRLELIHKLSQMK